ncbi:hypothetical protein [Accumulibacter sp.]|uniref:hypothetical protein n=1 Tax=Accumulibacter sp. TaxID=2053492 RepID=UPI002628FB0A|nr:hypothetical protein [Accumulibacter sp.]HRD94599.1 hypothetical protein [Accumulibacter sp.]
MARCPDPGRRRDLDAPLFTPENHWGGTLALIGVPAFFVPALAADQAAAIDFAATSGCRNCHTIDKKLVGFASAEQLTLR